MEETGTNYSLKFERQPVSDRKMLPLQESRKKHFQGGPITCKQTQLKNKILEVCVTLLIYVKKCNLWERRFPCYLYDNFRNNRCIIQLIVQLI